MKILTSKIKKILFLLISLSLISKNILSQEKNSKNHLESNNSNKIEWREINNNSQNIEDIEWSRYEEKSDKNDQLNFEAQSDNNYQLNNLNFVDNYDVKLSSINRSIVIDDIVGPDVSWLVPVGFKNNNFKIFDTSIRGFNRRSEGQDFLGWNKGDAVGQSYLNIANGERSSFGLNLGMRSIRTDTSDSKFGEGLSLGFRYGKNLSSDSGYAIGAEQLLHFDSKTDTGRDLFITFSKGWWKKRKSGNFPLLVSTAGFATGKMAEGNIKGLCSDLFGGSGTEINYQRSLCWSPVFSVAQVFNENMSAFFEYNSKFFLVGSSIKPIYEIPLRATFALILSDHIDNYKVNNFDELRWVFRLSLAI